MEIEKREQLRVPRSRWSGTKQLLKFDIVPIYHGCLGAPFETGGQNATCAFGSDGGAAYQLAVLRNHEVEGLEACGCRVRSGGKRNLGTQSSVLTIPTTRRLATHPILLDNLPHCIHSENALLFLVRICSTCSLLSSGRGRGGVTNEPQQTSMAAQVAMPSTQGEETSRYSEARAYSVAQTWWPES
jgi:hypothetical protein